MEKHKLYLIGGTARTMKSLIADKVAQTSAFVDCGTLLPRLKCPIIKNLFVSGIAHDAHSLIFNGTIMSGWDDSSGRHEYFFPIPPEGMNIPGKTSSVNSLKNTPAILLRTDYVRDQIILKEFTQGPTGFLGFNGEVICAEDEERISVRIPDNDSGQTSPDFVAWKAIAGFLQTCDAGSQHDVIVEGIAITPELVNELKRTLTHGSFDLRVAFTGYHTQNHTNHVKAYVEYLKNIPEKDKGRWFYKDFYLVESGRGKTDEEIVEEFIQYEIGQGYTRHQRKEDAEQYNFPYFDFGEYARQEDFIEAVTSHLLS